MQQIFCLCLHHTFISLLLTPYLLSHLIHFFFSLIILFTHHPIFGLAHYYYTAVVCCYLLSPCACVCVCCHDPPGKLLFIVDRLVIQFVYRLKIHAHTHWNIIGPCSFVSISTTSMPLICIVADVACVCVSYRVPI